MPRLDYRALRALIPIRVVLEELHYVPLRIRGDQWRGPCPLRGAGDPADDSFAVHLGKHAFFCHRCHRGGNQLDLWAAFIDLPLHPASLNLCERLHLDPPLLPEIRNRPHRPS
jgi:hypothetical protein